MKLKPLIAGMMSIAATSAVMTPGEAGATQKPNILFVIMDDVGIDQLSTFGYGGETPPVTPTIDAVAAKGIKFRNNWSMPECSNGRAALMTGRFPFRNNVRQALFGEHLANSQVSPFDLTVPLMLKPAGYKSALFGKYHLGGPENNKSGDGAPASMGWDYFYGWVGGVPASIDTTAGGVGTKDTYKCGYVPSVAQETRAHEGANKGACYVPTSNGDVSCTVLNGTDLGNSAGLRCLNMGGVLVPKAGTCQSSVPAGLDFDVQNAHYVSQLVINDGDKVDRIPVSDPQNRKYRATIEVDAAIDWINEQKADHTPWMATVSFTNDHTPLQTPPGELLSVATRYRLAEALRTLGSNCDNYAVGQALSKAMIEAMDTELGRLLVSTGLATRREGGRLVYNPKATNTVIVIVGDNGSFGNTVQAPFDPFRAKATAYQTGVWVPLVVSGSLVNQPGRTVEHMTNVTDVFGLFGEMAGIDPIAAAAPRRIDSYPLLAYLQNPAQSSLRQFNYTEGGNNILKDDKSNPPCVIGSVCLQTAPDLGVCEDNYGVYWGPNPEDETVKELTNGQGVNECWEVNKAMYSRGPAYYERHRVDQFPLEYYAARDSRFKLVRNFWEDYDPGKNPKNPATGPTGFASEELYEIDQVSGPTVKLDWKNKALFTKLNGVVKKDFGANSNDAKASYKALSLYLAQEFASEPECPGDGNDDGIVNSADLRQYTRITRNWSGSSVYDFNHDAVTDQSDRITILKNMGLVCRTSPR